MIVTILQIDIEWGRPQENIRRAEQLMNEVPGSDLYVLPEMWSTGFATDPHDIVESETENIALEWMRETSKCRHCAISGSLAVKVDSVYRNRHYFVDGRNGVEQYYDKHHLFRYGHEDRYYQAGNEHTIVEYEGFRILLLTCYDLRFPMWSRYADSLTYDAIICAANWPESRQNAWQILTRARAIENQAYLIACNRVGNDPYSHYRGQSALISPIGKTLASCPANQASATTYSLDLEALQHQRSKFRVLDDRDLK